MIAPNVLLQEECPYNVEHFLLKLYFPKKDTYQYCCLCKKTAQNRTSDFFELNDYEELASQLEELLHEPFQIVDITQGRELDIAFDYAQAVSQTGNGTVSMEQISFVMDCFFKGRYNVLLENLLKCNNPPSPRVTSVIEEINSYLATIPCFENQSQIFPYLYDEEGDDVYFLIDFARQEEQDSFLDFLYFPPTIKKNTLHVCIGCNLPRWDASNDKKTVSIYSIVLLDEDNACFHSTVLHEGEIPLPLLECISEQMQMMSEDAVQRKKFLKGLSV